MQKLATNVFIISSLLFAIVGIIGVISGAAEDSEAFYRVLAIIVFVILSSFALSIAGKYLR